MKCRCHEIEYHKCKVCGHLYCEKTWPGCPRCAQCVTNRPQAGTDTTGYFVALVRLVDDNKDESNTRCGILAPDEVAAIEWCIAHL